MSEPEKENNSAPEIKKGWLIQCEDEMDQEDAVLQQWKSAHANFVPWWESDMELSHYAGFVASDASESFCGPSTLNVIFDSKKAAEKFGEIDRAIASQMRDVQPVYYFRLPQADMLEIDEDPDDLILEFIDVPGCIGLFLGGAIIAFDGDEDGRTLIVEFNKRLGFSAEPDWEAIDHQS